jgi:hypothetical protein
MKSAAHSIRPANYFQALIVQGEERCRLLRWVNTSKIHHILVPTSASNTLAILGVGPFFDPIIRKEVTCICFAPATGHKGEAPGLNELVAFLRKD